MSIGNAPRSSARAFTHAHTVGFGGELVLDAA
jgi:hypothetical protein